MMVFSFDSVHLSQRTYNLHGRTKDFKLATTVVISEYTINYLQPQLQL